MLGFAGIVQSGRSQALLLDTYSGAAAAYSLRKLRTAYTGSALRVRASSNGVEADIGFNSLGNLDEVALINHVGYQNFILYSEQFDNAWWTKFESSITSNNATDPIGGSTADSIVETNANNVHRVSVSGISLLSNTTYTVSAYAKSINVGFLNIAAVPLTTPTATVYEAYFDLINGTVAATGTGASAAIVNVGNGWYRCSVTFSSGNATSGNFFFNPATNSTSYSYQGINGRTNINLWGAQLNVGTSAQTYQQTTTFQRDGAGFVTTWYDQSGNARNATQATASAQPRIVNAGVVEKVSGYPVFNFDAINDNLSLLNNSFGITTNLSVFASLSRNSFAANAGYFSFIPSASSPSDRDWASASGRSFNQGDINTRLVQYIAHLQFSGSNGFSDSISINSNSGNINSRFILSSITSGGTANLKVNNGSLQSDTYNGSPTAPNGLIIGCRYDTNAQLFSDIRFNELLIYASDQSSNRTSIESNINTYFSIY